MRGWPDLLKDELLKHYNPGRLMYLVNKYLRPEAIIFSVRSVGIRRTIGEIFRRIFGKNNKVKNRDARLQGRRIDPDRERYVGIVKRFVEDSGGRMSLRQITKEIKANGKS